MIIAVDVHYLNSKACAASIEFENWSDSVPVKSHQVVLDIIEEYIPGEFYKRELPPILKVLNHSHIIDVETIVVDGYVFLDDNGKPGLGAHLFKALNEKIPIIGVAKKSFLSNKSMVKEILRGESKKPLYISSIGMGLDTALDKISKMTGVYRIPDLLKIVDRNSKDQW